jgi:hypothetical protein
LAIVVLSHPNGRTCTLWIPSLVSLSASINSQLAYRWLLLTEADDSSGDAAEGIGQLSLDENKEVRGQSIDPLVFLKLLSGPISWEGFWAVSSQQK